MDAVVEVREVLAFGERPTSNVEHPTFRERDGEKMKYGGEEED